MILIKIGGSVITQKNEPFTPNLKNLYAVARTIAEYWSNGVSKTMCIIHGGGSFAHVVASQYIYRTTLNRRGISLITWSARKLNDRVVESLIDFDLPAFPLQTSSLFFVSGGKPKMHTRVVREILNGTWIPVLYGDIVVGDGEAQILSGEEIIEALSEEFDIEKIIVCTDTSGVLVDKNKPEKGIFKSINPQNIQSVMKILGASSGIDVTGGMKQKVETLYRIATRKGISSVIIDGTDPKTLSNCLNNQNVVGTFIEGHP